MPFDADDSRLNRMNRLNRPEFAPGQEVDPFASLGSGGTDMNDPFGGSGGGDPFGGMNSSDPFGSSGSGDMGGMGGGDPFADPFGGTGEMGMGGGSDPFGSMGGSDPFGAGANPFGATPMLGGDMGMQTQTQKSEEDVFFEAVGKGAKSSVNFFKEYIDSFKGLTPLFWVNYGNALTKVGVALVPIGIVLKLFHFGKGLNISIGGCLCGAIGAFLWLGLANKARGIESEVDNGGSAPIDQDVIPESFPQDTGENDFFNFDDTPSDSGFEDLGSSDDEEYPDEDDEYEEEEEDDIDWSNAFNNQNEAEAGMSSEEALATMPEVQKGMYTRQYLYETFIKVLPKITPNYDKVYDIDEDSDEFLMWGDYLRESAEVTGLNEDNLPELTSLQKTSLTMKLTSTRPKGIKAEVIADELAKIYAYNLASQGLISDEEKSRIYGKAETIGQTCIYTIFTANSPMVSLRDMLKSSEKYMLDISKTLPVTLGITETGKVLTGDFRKAESILIAGMPRTGKSWFAKAILAQICALHAPSDVQFYVADPKADTSDFYNIHLPHIKKFVSEDADIIKMFDYIINDLAPRRKKLIGDAGCLQIWDYKKKHPEVNIPSVIYVLIDELVTLSSRMDKETKAEFQKGLTAITTQFPNIGIRVMLVPHVLKNDIVAKTVSDNIACRISVMGTPDHVEVTTGCKPKDFPYKLANVGDMAVRWNDVSQGTIFNHGVILASDDDTYQDIFDYIGKVWAKLEPEQVKGSRAEIGLQEESNEVLLNDLDMSDTSDDDIFFNDTSSNTQTDSVFTNTNSNGLSGFNFGEDEGENSDVVDLF